MQIHQQILQISILHWNRVHHAVPMQNCLSKPLIARWRTRRHRFQFSQRLQARSMQPALRRWIMTLCAFDMENLLPSRLFYREKRFGL